MKKFRRDITIYVRCVYKFIWKTVSLIKQLCFFLRFSSLETIFECLSGVRPSANQKIFSELLAILCQLFNIVNPFLLTIVKKKIHKKYRTVSEPMKNTITCWNTLFPSLKKQFLNRNFTLCLRVALVNVIEEFLSFVVHLTPNLSTVPLFLLENRNQILHKTP